MVAALLKFTQGVTTAPAGEALIATTGAFTAAASGLAGNPTYFEFWVLDVPPGSAQPLGLIAAGSATSVTLLSDLPGGILVYLLAQDAAGNRAEDWRVFQVAEPAGGLIPPFMAKAPALNFSGGTRGWATLMEYWLRKINSSGGAIVYNMIGPDTEAIAEKSGRVTVLADVTAGDVVISIWNNISSQPDVGFSVVVVDVAKLCGIGNYKVFVRPGIGAPMSPIAITDSPGTLIDATVLGSPGEVAVFTWTGITNGWVRQ